MDFSFFENSDDFRIERRDMNRMVFYYRGSGLFILAMVVLFVGHLLSNYISFFYNVFDSPALYSVVLFAGLVAFVFAMNLMQVLLFRLILQDHAQQIRSNTDRAMLFCYYHTGGFVPVEGYRRVLRVSNLILVLIALLLTSVFGYVEFMVLSSLALAFTAWNGILLKTLRGVRPGSFLQENDFNMGYILCEPKTRGSTQAALGVRFRTEE